MKSNIEPKEGMLATYHINADSYPLVIEKVQSSKSFVASNIANYNEDTDKKEIDGVEYLIKQNPKLYGRTLYTKRKNGLWIESGAKMRYWGYVVPGYAESYLDPSF